MNSLSQKSKDKIVSDLKQVSNDWDSLLSKYDEEVLTNQQDIDKLSKTLDSLKDNKSISDLISKEIQEKESNIEKIKSSKKDLIAYLDIKKSQIEKLISRSEIHEDNKKEIMETLKWNIENMNSELQKLKEHYDAMVSFPKIQENIQIEMEKLSDDIFAKEKELKQQETSGLLSKTLLEKVNAMWWKKLLEKDFGLYKYELKKKNENSYIFVDHNWEEITKIENLWLDINRHGPYSVRKLNDNFLTIVSNDNHYVYDLKRMKILWRDDGYGVNVIKYDWYEYVGLKDVENSVSDKYSVFDLKTGEKFFDQNIKWKISGISKIGDKEILYTCIYNKNGTQINFYSKEDGALLNSQNNKWWYAGDKVVFGVDELSKLNLESYKYDFMQELCKIDWIFFIFEGWNPNYVKIMDSKYLNEIGDFHIGAGPVKTQDDSVILVKHIENYNYWTIFDFTNKKDLSSDYCDTKFKLRDYDDYCVFRKPDGNNIILNKKTKKVIDCMWRVYDNYIAGTRLLLIDAQKNNYQIKRLVNVDKAEILSTKNTLEETIEDIYLFRVDGSITSNAIVKLKRKNGACYYSYINLIKDIDDNWKLKIDKTYHKMDIKSGGYELSWLFSKIKIDWHGNKI